MKSINLDINPESYFGKELANISDARVRHLTIESLNKAPSYFWVVPASSSGKYHPKSSLGMHGLVRHVRSVCAVGEELLGHRLYAPFTEHEKDLVRSALILHDTFKQGIGEWGTTTVTEHPLLVRWHGRPDNYILNTEGAEQDWDTICNLIETHMGIWTTDRDGKQVLQEPQTAMQKFVHLCDYIASRKIITVDIEERGEQVMNAAVAKPFEPATDKQVSYLQSLYMQADMKGLKLDPIKLIGATGERILSKSEAGALIESTKKALGF